MDENGWSTTNLASDPQQVDIDHFIQPLLRHLMIVTHALL